MVLGDYILNGGELFFGTGEWSQGYKNLFVYMNKTESKLKKIKNLKCLGVNRVYRIYQ